MKKQDIELNIILPIHTIQLFLIDYHLVIINLQIPRSLKVFSIAFYLFFINDYTRWYDI